MTSLSVNDEQAAGARPTPTEPHEVEYSIRPIGDTVAARAENVLHQVNAKLAEHMRYIATVQNLYSDEGLRTQVAAFSETQAARTVEVHAAEVNDRVAEAAARPQAVLDSLVHHGDAAEEARNARFWDRSVRQLDAAPKGEIHQVARRIIAGAKADELGVVVAEIGPYLQSRNVGDAWLDTALQERVPALAQARREAHNAEMMRQVLSYSFKKIREGIAAGRPVTVIPSAAEFDPDRR